MILFDSADIEKGDKEMNKKIGFFASIFGATVIGAAIVTSNISFSSPLFTNATGKLGSNSYSLTLEHTETNYDSSNGIFTLRTADGNMVYAKSINSKAIKTLSSTYVGYVANIGNYSTYGDLSIDFYKNPECTQLFKFKNITSIDVYTNGSSSYACNFDVNISSDGVNFTKFGDTISSTSNTDASTIDFIGTVNYLRITNSSTLIAFERYITKIDIFYNCVSGGEDEPEQDALSSIEIVKDANKKEFNVKDEFTAEGIEVKAHYTSGSVVDVPFANLTFSSPDMLTKGTKTITVSYSDGVNTETCTYDILVKEASSSPLANKEYVNSSNDAYKIKFIDSEYGYQTYGSEFTYFTYVINGTKVTVTCLPNDPRTTTVITTGYSLFFFSASTKECTFNDTYSSFTFQGSSKMTYNLVS